jgi:hypothetical protein
VIVWNIASLVAKHDSVNFANRDLKYENYEKRVAKIISETALNHGV